MILNGGVFQSNSTTTYTDKFRNEVSGTNRWLSWWDGGFAGGAGTLTVNLRGNGSAVDWTGNGDTGIGNSMKFNSPTAQNPVIFQNGLNLDGAVRAIYVDNNPNNFNNYAIMSGVISNGAGGTASGLVKNGPGRLVLTGVNTYGDGAGYDNRATQINQGVLQADWGVGYSSNSGLILNGGVLQSNSAVTFTNRMWYDGWNDSVTWYSGGFSAGGGKMTVNLYGDDRTISFGTDPRGSIAGTMILSSNSAQYETEFQNGLNLNGGARTIEVDDNPNSSGDFASLSGVISDSVGGGSWTKTGIGTLYIKGTASNTYTGATTFTGGTIYLSKTGGAVAIPGNLNIADGAGRTYVVLGGNNEIAPSAVFSSVTPIYWGDLELNGYQQTLAGISSDAWATISNGGNTDSTLTVNNSGNYTFAGRLVNNINSASGKLVLVKTGSGTLNLSGTNTYTGATTISGGTLQLGSASVWAIPRALRSTAGPRSDLYGQIPSTTAALSLAGTGVGGAGALLNSSSTAATYSGSISGSFTVGGTGNITLSGSVGSWNTLTKVGSNTVTLSGSSDNTGLSLAVNAGAVVLAKSVNYAIGDRFDGQRRRAANRQHQRPPDLRVPQYQRHQRCLRHQRLEQREFCRPVAGGHGHQQCPRPGQFCRCQCYGIAVVHRRHPDGQRLDWCHASLRHSDGQFRH